MCPPQVVLLFCLFGGAMPCGEVSAQTRPPALSEDADPHVAVKQTTEAQIVYTEHPGAYWTVGPQFRRLRDYMLAQGQSGPMFVRFLSAPGSVPANALRTEVGFFPAGEHEPEPPFKKGKMNSEMVAFMEVDAPFVTPSSYLPYLRSWIEERGYDTLGPVTEIYELEPDGNRTAPRITVQIAIGAPVASVPSEQATVAVVPTEVTGSGGHTVSHRRIAESPDRDAPVSGNRSVGPQLEPLSKDCTTEPTTELPSPRAVDDSPAPVQPSPSDATIPMSRLLDERRFEEAATRLLPVGEAIPPSLQLWIGQVVFRISAADEGVEQVDGEANTILASLSRSIARRYDEVRGGYSGDPLEQAVTFVDGRSDPLADEKRAIMRDLDTLLGRIALGSDDAGATLASLCAVIQSVDDLVQSVQRTGRG